MDNCASTSFTNNKSDFINKPQPIKATVTGIGKAKVSLQGTVKWTINNNHGQAHAFIIPDVVYNPNIPWRLLSPQQLAQSKSDKADGTGCITYSNRIQLFWDNQKFTKTIPLNESNIGLMTSKPGTRRFVAFASELATQEPAYITNDNKFNPRPVSPDGNKLQPSLESQQIWQLEQSNHQQIQQEKNDQTNMQCTQVQQPEQTNQCKPVQNNFHDHFMHNTNGILLNITEKQSELYKWHLKLNHAPNSRLREMAKQGQAPKHFLTTKLPVCKACIYGKMTRQPWRVKGQTSNINNFRRAKSPGETVSVDQLESPEPGFIVQLKGKLTTQWYKVATVFVDHYSSLGFLYLQQSTSAKETIEAKQAFEQFASSQGITI